MFYIVIYIYKLYMVMMRSPMFIDIFRQYTIINKYCCWHSVNEKSRIVGHQTKPRFLRFGRHKFNHYITNKWGAEVSWVLGGKLFHFFNNWVFVREFFFPWGSLGSAVPDLDNVTRVHSNTEKYIKLNTSWH